MAYSETRIVIGGLAHVPVLILIANFIKGKFGIKTEGSKDTIIKKKSLYSINSKIMDLRIKTMIINIYWLNKSNLKIKFMLKYFSSH